MVAHLIDQLNATVYGLIVGITTMIVWHVGQEGRRPW